MIPADELDVRGKFVSPRVTREGAGAPLVAVRREQAPEIRQRFLPPRIYLGVTAAAHFSGRKCEIEFLDPLSVERVSVAGRGLPSAADFTAPMAVGLCRERPEKVGVPALLDPDKFANNVRLIQVPTVQFAKHSGPFRSRSSVHACELGTNAECALG